MSWIITDPRGVEAALKNENPTAARETERLPRALEEISAHNADDRNFRLSVYAEGYFSRLLEAIEADYPLTKNILGEELFQICIAHYLKAYPSKTHDLGEIGEHLPKFLAEQKIFKLEPYVSFVAAVEFAKVPAFFAPEEKTEKGAEMRQLGEDLFDARAVFGNSLQLVASPWNIDAILGLEENKSAAPTKEESLYIVYQNENNQVEISCLRTWKKQILENFRDGQSLATALSDLEATEEEIQPFFTHLQQKNILWDFTL
jgi:hypothetical protein